MKPDLDLMIFNGLTQDVLERAQRFLRLWTNGGLMMWELDWALGQTPSGLLDQNFLIFLSGAIAVRTRLGLPFQEVLTFWGPLETRDVVSHLGDEDVVVPSTYSEVFANPTMLASWGGVFPTVASQPPGSFTLSGVPLDDNHLAALSSALGLSVADVSAILQFAGVPSTFTLAALKALLQYARLAAGLALDVNDLFLWIELTGGTPFDTTPADTLEFFRRLAVLQGTGMAVHDLDYLLRDQLTSQSTLAFTPAQATAVLQTIADAIAKLMPTSAIGVTGATNAAPIVVTTAAPHGLATGMQATITGVNGNTAANGPFTITVTSPSAFALNGSTGNGIWTGGGVVVADITVTGALNATPIAITTLTPHGLQTGAQVAISGVQGNTAANGLFTIMATGPTAFTLNGSSGNGSWTAGGIVAAGAAITIQTIVIQALVTAASAPANVVTPVLAKTGVLPLSAATLSALVRRPAASIRRSSRRLSTPSPRWPKRPGFIRH